MGCLSASLGVYSTNFAKILRSTWIWVLALSVVLGLATFVSPLAVLGANSMGQFAGTIAAGCMIAVASVVLDSVVKSNVVVMLNDEKRGVAFRKMLKVDVFSIVLFAVCLMVFAGSTYLLMSIESVRTLPASTFTVMLLAVYLCLFMLLALLASPYIYSVSKYIFNKETKFKNLVGSDYAKGYKKLGFVFSILLLLILVGALVMRLIFALRSPANNSSEILFQVIPFLPNIRALQPRLAASCASVSLSPITYDPAISYIGLSMYSFSIPVPGLRMGELSSGKCRSICWALNTMPSPSRVCIIKLCTG